jgi:hypothetical protein
LHGNKTYNSFVSTDEDPGLRIESFAVINLRGVSTNKTIIFTVRFNHENTKEPREHPRCFQRAA